jgi:hypothetical protein
MKAMTAVFALLLFLLCNLGKTQTISLAFSGLNNGMAVPLEKIKIENLDKSCDTTLFYPNSTLVLQVLGIGDPAGSPERLIVFQNSPNPVTETTSIKIFNPENGYISLAVMDISGKQVCSFSENMERGYHIFDFSPGNNGTFVFSVSAKGSSRSIKVTSSVLKENGAFSLQYSGKMSDESISKEAMSGVFVFSSGDHLRYTGYYNSLTKVLEDSPQNSKSYTFGFGNSGFTCGQSITIHHLAGEVAPVNKTTTYGTVTGIPGEPSKCWITSNLGSDHQASAVNDATEASAGWYWQFNRKKGYKNDGSTLTPAWTITSINENSDWQTANDPCTLELRTAWRLPTYTEWNNVYSTGGWTNWNGPWGSGLKLHAAGYLSYSNGALYNRGSNGTYCSSTQNSTDNGWHLYFYSGLSFMSNSDKAYGFSARCLRD